MEERWCSYQQQKEFLAIQTQNDCSPFHPWLQKPASFYRTALDGNCCRVTMKHSCNNHAFHGGKKCPAATHLLIYTTLSCLHWSCGLFWLCIELCSHARFNTLSQCLDGGLARCLAQEIRSLPDMQQTKECVSGLLTLALSMGFLSSPSERYGPGCQHKWCNC